MYGCVLISEIHNFPGGTDRICGRPPLPLRRKSVLPSEAKAVQSTTRWWAKSRRAISTLSSPEPFGRDKMNSYSVYHKTWTVRRILRHNFRQCTVYRYVTGSEKDYTDVWNWRTDLKKCSPLAKWSPLAQIQTNTLTCFILNRSGVGSSYTKGHTFKSRPETSL